MRLWSLHPRYLDAKGLVALWREALLAKAVLEGKTKGYASHPQLERFRSSKQPLRAINSYLGAVYSEACSRGYCFNRSKFKQFKPGKKIPVTSGQVNYEALHLAGKLKVRDKIYLKNLRRCVKIELNPVFLPRGGAVESFEKTKRAAAARGRK